MHTRVCVHACMHGRTHGCTRTGATHEAARVRVRTREKGHGLCVFSAHTLSRDKWVSHSITRSACRKKVRNRKRTADRATRASSVTLRSPTLAPPRVSARGSSWRSAARRHTTHMTNTHGSRAAREVACCRANNRAQDIHSTTAKGTHTRTQHYNGTHTNATPQQTAHTHIQHLCVGKRRPKRS